ncbi:unnamed protein product [Adineta ricciae]|uniref:Uncharacterized protein n=1 Tax=Adineta ricciae TaxID=249248 RepID=A0A814KQD8_ADIRI|nr:unnamed protein product [Adineta ricciae]CAF1317785.1 unnamed protein product [Adineta ricciae]
MPTDDEDLSTFYANLPSIFESHSSISNLQSNDVTTTLIDNEKPYQPMFGSFLFTDSEPFTRAAFIEPSISSPTEGRQQLDNNTVSQANNSPNSNNIQTTSIPSLALPEDIDDEEEEEEEDDFDGIPIQHASPLIKPKHNGDMDSFINHSEHDNTLEEFIHHVENNNEYDIDDVESILNDFHDDEQEQYESQAIPSLFKDIPDIDDLNAHEDKDIDGIPFDHMDMLDQSDSIRSSSPDSVLSSSHLRDDDDDDDLDVGDQVMNINEDADDDDDDVTQWNDDFILNMKSTPQNDRPNAPLPPSINLNIHPHDQVDFIDSSRSTSRCSNASSRLSVGYGDQAQIFINGHDGLESSSESDSEREDDDNLQIDLENDLPNCDTDEELALQVNLDYHRSKSSSSHSSSSCSTRSTSPIVDQTPIVDMDADIVETKPIETAPIALADDDDNDDDDELVPSDQPVLPIIIPRNPWELKFNTRQNEIVRDIINLRHILNEHDSDDEFIAVMHNPSVFEEVLLDKDEQQQVDLTEQTNVRSSTSQITPRLLSDNKFESESVDQYQNIEPTASSSEESRPWQQTTTNNYSASSSVNHLLIRKREKDEEEEENVSISNWTSIKQTEEQQSRETILPNNDIQQLTTLDKSDEMNSGEDDNDYNDDDLELLNTLAQFHGIVHAPNLSPETHSTFNNISHNYDKHHFISNLLSTSSIDKEENPTLFNNLLTRNENDEHLTDRFLSTNPFTNQKSHSPDLNLNSHTSSSLSSSSSSTNEFTDSIQSLNPLVRGDVQFTSTNTGDLFAQMTKENMISNWDSLSTQSTYDIVSSNIDENNLTNYFCQPSDMEVPPLAESLVSNIDQSAVGETDRQTEHVVKEILSNAIDEVSKELPTNDGLQTQTILNKSVCDPFDENFNTIWSEQFDNYNTSSLFSSSHSQLMTVSMLLTNPFHSDVTMNQSCKFQDDFASYQNESSLTTDEQVNDGAWQTKNSTETRNADTSEEPTSENENDDNLKFDKQENFFNEKSRFSQFEAYASDQPLKTLGIGSIVAEIDSEFNDSSQMQESTTSIDRQSEMITSVDGGHNDNEPWELDDSGEEKITPIQTTTILQKNDSYNNFFSEQQSSAIATATTLPATTEGSDDEIEEENYDDYFNQNQVKGENEVPSNKTVRFDENNIENVAVLTPKDSLEESETPQTPPDSDDDDDDDEEHIAINLRMASDRITDHMNDNNINYEEKPAEAIVNKTVLRPESEISLADSEDLPPPLPPLPPLNKKSGSSTDNIPSKSSSLSSTSVDLKRNINSRTESEPTATIQTITTEAKLHNNPDPQATRSFDSGIVKYSNLISS